MLVTFQLDGEEFMAPIRYGLRNESGRARRSATPTSRRYAALCSLRQPDLSFVICHLSCASPALQNFKTKVLISVARSSYHLSEQQYEQSTSIGWHQKRCIHSDC